MFFIRIAVSWATLVLVLSACATNSEQGMSLEQKLESRNYTVGEPVSRIRNFNINGWSELDDYHIIITAGVRDDYLVNLRHRCSDLRGATRIGFSSFAGSLTDKDKLLVTGPGGFTERCHILSISKLYKGDRESSDS